ncbi:hypothetical protein [Amycolatopsis regifaucium]|nr:hypothetical protein [Amycolatopsis regifaucium]SFH65249.1 hypothetical protein SAMN04489731_105404 [Amycolatopsis regifaucium]
MKFRFSVEARCIDFPALPTRWWIIIVVVILLVQGHEGSELITLLHH